MGLILGTLCAVLCALLGIDSAAWADTVGASITGTGTPSSIGNRRAAEAFTPDADMTVTGMSMEWGGGAGAFRVGISLNVGGGEPAWVGSCDVTDDATSTIGCTGVSWDLTNTSTYYLTVISEDGSANDLQYRDLTGRATTGGTWGAIKWGVTLTNENTDTGFLFVASLTVADVTGPCGWSVTTDPDNRTPGSFGTECLPAFAEATADNTRRIGDVLALGFGLVLFVGGFQVGTRLVP